MLHARIRMRLQKQSRALGGERNGVNASRVIAWPLDANLGLED